MQICSHIAIASTDERLSALQEELANVNMAKYRKLQQEMEGAVERADMAENTLGQLRARNRSASVAPETTSTFGLTV